MSILTINYNASITKIEFEGNPIVKDVLEANNILISHPCGGRGLCGNCEITIIGNVSPPDEKEIMFDRRLSCRTRLLGDATLFLNSMNEMVVETSEMERGDLKGEEIGAAVDIGTTTVVVSVFDIKEQKLIKEEGSINPQTSVSADVIGRISNAANLAGETERMQRMIEDCILDMTRKTGYLEDISKWVITGNTTMLYLLTGRNPKALGSYPFKADFLFDEEINFYKSTAYLPQCISAFVGADIVCAVINGKLFKESKTILLADIGTNGEIALWKNGKLYVTSTAAGPAFEGASIECGMRGLPGAIEKVWKNTGGLSYLTIGSKEPEGICGSGIIDLIALFLDMGVIDETGTFIKDYPNDRYMVCNSIYLSQKDIRAVQTAKAAVHAGIETLLNITDTDEAEIKEFIIAGGFGKHINIESAIKIGLFPKLSQAVYKPVGNAALKGAADILFDDSIVNETKTIFKNAEVINLGGNSEFEKLFLEKMYY